MRHAGVLDMPLLYRILAPALAVVASFALPCHAHASPSAQSELFIIELPGDEPRVLTSHRVQPDRLYFFGTGTLVMLNAYTVDKQPGDGWVGVGIGAVTLALGLANVHNKTLLRTFTSCPITGYCFEYHHYEVDPMRTLFSYVNIGIGAVNVLASGYRLLTRSAADPATGATVSLTQLGHPAQDGEAVAAVQLVMRF